MKQKPSTPSYYTNANEFESKEYSGSKMILSKFDYELFDEEQNVAKEIVRVKRVGLPNKGERWRIMIGNNIVFTIEGTKISKKERNYLRTPEGISFLIGYAKGGIKSLHSLRTELKTKIK